MIQEQSQLDRQLTLYKRAWKHSRPSWPHQSCLQMALCLRGFRCMQLLQAVRSPGIMGRVEGTQHLACNCVGVWMEERVASYFIELLSQGHQLVLHQKQRQQFKRTLAATLVGYGHQAEP